MLSQAGIARKVAMLEAVAVVKAYKGWRRRLLVGIVRLKLKVGGERVMASATSLPIPSHFRPEVVGEVWRVPYKERAAEAKAWAKQQGIRPAASDRIHVGLLAIDVQNTFCIPEHELFIGGRSGVAAVEDNVRLCEFIYRNLGILSKLIFTLDTHTTLHIFHPIFWVDDRGEHPTPATTISLRDVQLGTWRVNPAIADELFEGDREAADAYALHYVESLDRRGKYSLTVWPYHSMLGGIGHAVVPAVEEAAFFHSIARQCSTQYELKGQHPLTEHYSVLQPEIPIDASKRKNAALVQQLLSFNALVIAGQAKSHCVVWTLNNLLAEIQSRNPQLARRIYLLEDCTSPVVIPGGLDFTQQADEAFECFAAAGMHVVRSSKPVSAWPDFPLHER